MSLGFELRVVFPSGTTRAFRWKNSICRIGRAPDADLRLVEAWAGDTSVSRKHASIAYAEGRFRIVDNDSRNGTYVNGRRVNHAWLCSGDKITIGHFELTFSVADYLEGTRPEKTSNIAAAHSSRLGPLKIIETVHTGLDTSVYKATTSDGTVVALKVATGDNDWIVSRLQGEWEVLSALAQCAIAVPVLGKARMGQKPGLVFDWRSGGSLRQLIQRSSRVHPDIATPMFQRISRCLHDLHTMGYAHNDIKPSNVLLDGMNEPLLADFGSCTKFCRTGRHEITGSVPYLAPERTKLGTAAAGTDIFSFGCLMFETIAGVPAFAGVSADEITMRIASHQYARTELTDVPKSIEVLIDKMLEPDPRKRLEMHEVGRSLQALVKR